jgi:hypothetical protein
MTHIFSYEVKTLCTKEKNHSRATNGPNLGNQLSEEIASYKTFVLTIPLQ